MNWLYYLLEANFYLAVFYAVYYFALRGETYYQLNRAYLLSICIISFIIPLTQIGSLHKYGAPPPPPAVPVMVVINQTAPGQAAAIPASTAHTLAPTNYYLMAYLLIASVMLISFAIKLFKLIRLSRHAKRLYANDCYMVEIASHNDVFSFFKYLFIDPKLADAQSIVQHELVHIRQKHSADILFSEFLKIVNWFNPVVYFLQNSLKELHEFIADHETARKQQDVNGYTDLLIHNAYGFSSGTLTNNFFNKNLLKKRIIMLHQKRSGSLARLKLLLILPLCMGLLCLSTLAFPKSYGYIDLLPHAPTVAGVAYTETERPPATQPVSNNKQIPPPPPPVYIKPNYVELGIYMQNHLNYPAQAKNGGKTGTVVLSFKLDSKHTITDVKVEKGIGSGLDEEGIRLLSGYKKPIKDKSGFHSIGLVFNIKGSPAETAPAETRNKTGFVGEIFLPGQLRYPPPVIKHDIAPKMPPPIIKGDKGIDNHTPPPPPAPPVNDKERLQSNGNMQKDSSFTSFYKALGKFIRYPTADLKNNIGGKVFVAFELDANHHVKGVRVLRSPSDALSKEVVRVINNSASSLNSQPNVVYTLPVNFSIQNSEGKYVDTHANVNANLAPVKSGEELNMSKKLTALNEVVIMAYPK